MGLVTRPTKTGGFTTYTEEVAAGNVIILASEVDADFNALITGGINNIETANVNATGLGTAAIADDAITEDKIANDAVTNDQIADNAVDTLQIADDAVTTAKILDENVTTDKIAIGDSINTFQVANVNTTLNFSTVETTLLTLPAITTRGGATHIFGSWALTMATTGGATEFITIRVKRDGSTIYTLLTQVQGNPIRTPVPFPDYTDLFVIGSPAAYVYTITGQGDTNTSLLTQSASAGTAFVNEPA